MSIEHEAEPTLRLRCPACFGPSRVRSSQDISPSTRRLYMQCVNLRCRCIFVSIAESTKVLAPSLLPESEQRPQMLTLRKGKRATEVQDKAKKPHQAENPRRRAKQKEEIPLPLDLASALL